MLESFAMRASRQLSFVLLINLADHWAATVYHCIHSLRHYLDWRGQADALQLSQELRELPSSHATWSV
jgi:hypothetical protein